MRLDAKALNQLSMSCCMCEPLETQPRPLVMTRAVRVGDTHAVDTRPRAWEHGLHNVWSSVVVVRWLGLAMGAQTRTQERERKTQSPDPLCNETLTVVYS